MTKPITRTYRENVCQKCQERPPKKKIVQVPVKTCRKVKPKYQPTKPTYKPTESPYKPTEPPYKPAWFTTEPPYKPTKPICEPLYEEECEDIPKMECHTSYEDNCTDEPKEVTKNFKSIFLNINLLDN